MYLTLLQRVFFLSHKKVLTPILFLIERRTPIRIPIVVATLPGQFRSKRGEHVVKGPAQDDTVVTVNEEHGDRCGPTDA